MGHPSSITENENETFFILVNSSVVLIFKWNWVCNDKDSGSPTEAEVAKVAKHPVSWDDVAENGEHVNSFEGEEGKNDSEEEM